ncbi:Uncharacterised protein [Vibrio cholerae]|nr:Uncharacterised protein [Vibrio cholerae]CSI66377.1 Uncharacterised protein [Vibrio cholerae]
MRRKLLCAVGTIVMMSIGKPCCGSVSRQSNWHFGLKIY